MGDELTTAFGKTVASGNGSGLNTDRQPDDTPDKKNSLLEEHDAEVGEAPPLTLDSNRTLILPDGTRKEFSVREHLMAIADSIDAQHNLPNESRFAPLNQLSAVEVYYVVSERLYTSSFNRSLSAEGRWEDLFDKMREEGVSLQELMDSPFLLDEKEQVRQDFLDNVVAFERQKDVLDVVGTTEQQIAFMRALVDDVPVSSASASADYENAIALSGFLKAVQDTDLRADVEKLIIEKHKASSGIQKDVWGTVISDYMRAHNGATALDQHAVYFQAISQAYAGKWDSLRTIPNVRSTMFDSQGNNHQLHIFYNEPEADNDGVQSYQTFKGGMKAKGWDIQENDPEAGVHMLSKEENGRRVYIHVAMVDGLTGAEDPSVTDKAEQKVKLIREKLENDFGEGEISVLVHRGHSYFFDDTLKYLNSDIKILHGGGCGGNDMATDIAAKNSTVHAFMTSGVGSRYVNNPTIQLMADSLLDAAAKGSLADTFDWDAVKSRLASINHDAAGGYIVPADNIALRYHSTFIQPEVPGVTVAPSGPVRAPEGVRGSI